MRRGGTRTPWRRVAEWAEPGSQPMRNVLLVDGHKPLDTEPMDAAGGRYRWITS